MTPGCLVLCAQVGQLCNIQTTTAREHWCDESISIIHLYPAHFHFLLLHTHEPQQLVEMLTQSVHPRLTTSVFLCCYESWAKQTNLSVIDLLASLSAFANYLNKICLCQLRENTCCDVIDWGVTKSAGCIVSAHKQHWLSCLLPHVSRCSFSL